MAQYDGAIRVKTDIEIKNAEIQLATLQNRMVKTADKIADLRSEMDAMKDTKVPTQEYTDLENAIASATKEMEKMLGQDSKLEEVDSKIKKLSQSATQYAEKMEKIAAQKIPTEEYKAAQKEADKYSAAIQKANEKIEKLLEVGTGRSNKDLEEARVEVEDLTRKLENAKKKKEEFDKRGLVNDRNKETIKVDDYTKQLEMARLRLEKLQETENKIIGSKIRTIKFDVELNEGKLIDVEEKLERLRSEGKAFTIGTDTDQYKNLSTKYESVNAELEKQKGIHSEIAQKQAESVQKVVELKGQMQELVDTGKAFTLGSDTEEFAQKGQNLEYLENDYDVLIQKEDIAREKVKRLTSSHANLGEVAKKSLNKIKKSQDDVNKSHEKSNGLLKTMASRFKGLVLSLLIFNQISKAFRSLSSAIKEGFSNLYNDSGITSFKSQVDELRASMLTLKNTFAAAFSPIVEIAIPYIQRFIEWITKAVNMVGQFIAALTGRKTYTRAIKQTAKASGEAEKATEKETEAIEDQTEEMNKQLSPLDRLNNLTSDKAKKGKDTSPKADDAGVGDGLAPMFEEVPIDSRILDFLQKLKDMLQPVIDYAKKLKDIFMQGFWDGLGDWEYRWESIKNSLKSIKDSLIDIFTDPAVLGAADSWAQSVAYMLGSLAGSVASIGLTIATNLIGGIALYLEQNKDRIKGYLISMFNIWEDINYLLAGFFQSFAYVFEAFASEQAQQLTANIIGIFADIFMGITELASKLILDIANIIIQPFVDNKEAFREALEGFLGVLSEVTGTIKQGLDDTFDHLNQMYDEHIKPFFDSVAQGLSDLVAQFMEFWNGSVQPILDEWAEKFDALWKEHIQPAVDKIIEMLGSVADSLKELWEDVLKPIVSWIIDNILPILLPIIDNLVTSIMDLVGIVSDVIGSIADIISDLIEMLVKSIKGDWKGMWELAGDIVKKAVDMIKGFIEGVVDKVTGFGAKLRSVFGGGTSKSNYNAGETKSGRSSYSMQSPYNLYPQIPKISDADIPGYATGQVIPRTMKQHLAILGDNNRETEVVSPLSTIKQASKEAVMEVLAGLGTSGGTNNSGTGGDIVIQIDGREIFRVTQKRALEYKKQTGSLAFT